MDFQSAAFPLALNDLLQWRWRISAQQCHLLAEFRWEREFAECSSKKALFLWKQKLQQPLNKSWGFFSFSTHNVGLWLFKGLKKSRQGEHAVLDWKSKLSWEDEFTLEWVHKCIVQPVYIQMLTKLSMKDKILQVQSFLQDHATGWSIMGIESVQLKKYSCITLCIQNSLSDCNCANRLAQRDSLWTSCC